MENVSFTSVVVRATSACAIGRQNEWPPDSPRRWQRNSSQAARAISSADAVISLWTASVTQARE